MYVGTYIDFYLFGGSADVSLDAVTVCAGIVLLPHIVPSLAAQFHVPFYYTFYYYYYCPLHIISLIFFFLSPPHVE